MGVGGAKNIFEESRPMFFITGLAGLRPPVIYKRAFPGYVYVTLVLVTYHLLYWFNLNDTLDFLRAHVIITRTSETREIQTFTNIAFVTVMIVTSVRASPRIRRLYVELSVADDKLKLLNVRFDYGRSARREAIHVARVVMITIVFNLVEYFPEIGPDYDSGRDLPWILGTLPQFIDSLAVASYVIVIGKIRRRLEAVNELIQNLAILDKSAVTTLESEMNSRK